MSDGQIVEKLKRSTPAASPDSTVEVIAEVVTELLSRHQVDAVGHRRGRVRRPDPVDRAVRAEPRLARRAGRRSWSRSASACRSWSRTTRTPPPGRKPSSARPAVTQHVVLITVGTGIGAGLVLDGQAVPRPVGHRGRARSLPGGAGRAPVRLRQPRLLGAVRERQRPGRGGARLRPALTRARRCGCSSWRGQRGRHRRAGGHAGRERGRPGGAALLRASSASWLGAGLADLAAILDPGCFVIGGGVSEAGELLLGPARAAYEHGLTGGPTGSSPRSGWPSSGRTPG